MSKFIIGREEELKVLQEIYESTEPQFLAVYGRRRIGKTYLISEFFKDQGLYFEITGTKDGTLKDQLYHFTYEYSRLFTQREMVTSPKSWTQAFHLLHDAIQKHQQNKKVILFFDEVPWLASPRSKFLSALEHFWNRFLSRNKNLVLIICGSSASWIIRNIINNKGGLYGRVTRKLRLLPFTLRQTEQYLRSLQIELDRKQVTEIYMAMGGVPKYLSYVTRGKSSAQIINEVCFSPQGGLYEEFHNLYKSLFYHHEHHVAIVKALAKSPKGLTKEQLLKKINLPSGGYSSRIISELVDAGFILYLPAYQKIKREGVFRLIDEYSLFYLTWIEGVSSTISITDPHYWTKKSRTPQWYSWSGSAFESICFRHIQNIKNALGISGISTIESEWHYLPKRGAIKERGAQIDLVIDRSDRCINLCEMKYTDSEYVLGKAEVETLQHKKQVFRKITKNSKTLFTTFISTYGVRKNSHSLSVLDQQLILDDLF